MGEKNSESGRISTAGFWLRLACADSFRMARRDWKFLLESTFDFVWEFFRETGEYLDETSGKVENKPLPDDADSIPLLTSLFAGVASAVRVIGRIPIVSRMRQYIQEKRLPPHLDANFDVLEFNLNAFQKNIRELLSLDTVKMGGIGSHTWRFGMLNNSVTLNIYMSLLIQNSDVVKLLEENVEEFRQPCVILVALLEPWQKAFLCKSQFSNAIVASLGEVLEFDIENRCLTGAGPFRQLIKEGCQGDETLIFDENVPKLLKRDESRGWSVHAIGQELREEYAANMFRLAKGGELWQVRFEGREPMWLPSSAGFPYISLLLKTPDKEWNVEDIETEVKGGHAESNRFKDKSIPLGGLLRRDNVLVEKKDIPGLEKELENLEAEKAVHDAEGVEESRKYCV